MTAPRIELADLSLASHRDAYLALMDVYASDPMGGGAPLEQTARARLVEALLAEPTVHVLLAFSGEEAVGLATCVRGFSTFRAAPLLNLHDFVVSPASRGQGVGKALLTAVEAHARSLGCCKVTLEVLSGNQVARRAYVAAGYAPYALDPAAGIAEFWHKSLA